MTIKIINADCREALRTLPDQSVHCCVTSPPYFGLRDYGHAGQIGLEPTPDEFVAAMVEVFREVKRVLRDDGTLWLNLGDSYNAQPGQRKVTDKAGSKQQSNAGSPGAPSRNVAGLKPKDLIGIPWRVAFALQADGWYLRQDIIWSKPNPMPESVQDRCTKAHEYIFMLSKSKSYYYDIEAIKEPATYPDDDRKARAHVDHKRAPDEMISGIRPRADKQRGHGRRHAGFNDRWDAMEKTEQCSGMRNKRSVWSVATQPFSEAHFATFPPALIEPCVKAGCPVGGTVLDPFGGAGTTGLVADRLQRSAILIELNPEYATMADRRIRNDAPLFAEAAE
jgi:DNA modification methylase